MSIDYENVVSTRYASAARNREAALCCPVEYPAKLLDVIPQEILDRDYGCGDPTPFVKTGDTVLDLGSGGGKLCYIASQLVGASGRVTGIDCNEVMLGLARNYQSLIAKRIGYDNVSFRCGMIQNLRLDLERYADHLQSIRASGVSGILERRKLEQRLCQEQPMVETGSIDCVLSNCVLNLVRPADRSQLFNEVFRVLKRGGRAAISDIVSDEDIPEHLTSDPQLWSGCIAGAWREDDFIREFERVGFHGIRIARRSQKPWQVIEGIEFRSVTVVAYKGIQGPCLERNQAVIYRGPFKKVEDDDGHVYYRGQRVAVCEKTFDVLQSDPYSDVFFAIEPYVEVPREKAQAFDCRRNARRHPRETKGMEYKVTAIVESACGNDGPCC